MTQHELTIAVRHPADSFAGKQITAIARLSAALVVLELADGSQIQFRATAGDLEVGLYAEHKH